MTSRVILHSVKTFAEQEPDLFYINRTCIEAVSLNVEQGRARLQAIIDEFLKVVGKPITIDELSRLYGTGRTNAGIVDQAALKELVISKLVQGKDTTVGGLKLSEEMLKSLLIVPDLTELMDAAQQLTDLPMVNYKDVFYWSVYTLDADGKVSVLPAQVELIFDQFRGYAVTPDQRSKLAKVKTLCRVLDVFIADKDVSGDKLNISGLVHYDNLSGRMEPSEQYVLYGLEKSLIFNH